MIRFGSRLFAHFVQFMNEVAVMILVFW